MTTLPPVRSMLGAKLRMAGHWVASVRTESKLKVAAIQSRISRMRLKSRSSTTRWPQAAQ